MGTGVGQVGASAYHGKLDTPAHQSLRWHLWQVSTTPCHPRWGNNTGEGGGGGPPPLQSLSTALSVSIKTLVLVAP